MQGFNYTQLYDALQKWPYKSSATYLANLNRMIWLGELRLLRDLDLSLFDVNDQVALTQGATTIPKPAGSQTLTFTANPAQGATSGTLTADWSGNTGSYVATFADGVNVTAISLTASSTAASWTTPLSDAQTAATLTLNPLFVVERKLWVVYDGVPKILRKRSYDFLQSYNPTDDGQPRYYADDGLTQWIISPAADSLATAVNRRYLQRPQSIVVAGNTFLGDNVGDVLFVACLMESEGFIKADDRYQDMARKYYQELLPAAKNEISIVMRKGDYSPLMPVAGLPAPPPPPQGQ